MSELLIRLRADGRSEWLDGAGRVQDGWPQAGEDDRVTVLVPAEDVLLLEAPRVAKSERQLGLALPFAIEDQLAAPVEQQHVAWAPARDGERVRVGVVAKDVLEAWLQRLRAAKLEPDAVLPDSLALPFADQRATALQETGRIVLRMGETQALAGTPDELQSLAGRFGQVDLWLSGASESILVAHAVQRIEQPLSAMKAQALQPALNLLQGAYAPRRRVGSAQRAWRWAAMLAGIALALLFLQAVVDRQKLAGKVADQQAEMEQLYRRAVPAATTVLDPAAQLQSVLAAQGLGQGDAALDLLGRVGPALTTDARLSLDALEYREQRLELVVQAPDVASLDGLRQRLAQAGLPTEITGTTPGTQGVQGRLRIGDQP